MWYKNENGDLTRPATLDKTSSKAYVYIRKDITLVEGTEDNPAHYEWMELKIPTTEWAVYEKVLGHDEALDDVYAALTELAEMIVEE